MLTSTAPGSIAYVGDAPATAAATFLTRKIWLPRLLYDSLPYFYLTAGFTAFFATLYISQWFWILPHYLLFSAGCVHLGTYVYRKRRTRDVKKAATDIDTREAL